MIQGGNYVNYFRWNINIRALEEKLHSSLQALRIKHCPVLAYLDQKRQKSL
jgi:hypothetical protein